MIEHMRMISKWEEFRRFFACVKPLDVRVYGKLSEEAERGSASSTYSARSSSDTWQASSVSRPAK